VFHLLLYQLNGMIGYLRRPFVTPGPNNSKYDMRSYEFEAIHTEVQLLRFVCSTGGKGGKPRLWNLQNLGAAPP